MSEPTIEGMLKFLDWMKGMIEGEWPGKIDNPEYEAICRLIEQGKPKVTKQELYDLGLHETRDAVNDLIELLKNRGVEVIDG